jgi:hypothetical protein
VFMANAVTVACHILRGTVWRAGVIV